MLPHSLFASVLAAAEFEVLAHPELRKWAEAVLRAAVPGKIRSVWRSRERQAEVYAWGRTVMSPVGAEEGKPLGPVATQLREPGAHGCRAGLVWGCDFETTLSGEERAGVIAENYGLTWGGRWKGESVDRPHVEVPGWREFELEADDVVKGRVEEWAKQVMYDSSARSVAGALLSFPAFAVLASGLAVWMWRLRA